MSRLVAWFGRLGTPLRRWNVRVMAWMLVGLASMVAIYSIVFHQIMASEGHDHSWASSVYWTLTTMSTLGYGDIVFESDGGKLFSLVVLTSGALSILVVLPFAFTQFILSPWMDKREAARVPRHVPDDLSGHIVVTSLDAVTQALLARARRARVPHVVLATDSVTAGTMQNMGYRTMLGPLDDPRTFRRAGVDRAALVATTLADTTNTNVVFTAREFSPHVHIAATADSPASVDILKLAGCDQVVELAKVLGTAMAQRAVGSAGHSHTVGVFGSIRVAEAGVAGTSMVGKTLHELDVPGMCGAHVLATYEKGAIQPPDLGTKLSEHSTLILAGTKAELAAYDQHFAATSPTERSALIIGGGRVGRAAARTLASNRIPYTVVERAKGRVTGDISVVLGDAAELDVLEQAGLDDASTALVTTHDDDVNVYLTLYCRRLRPDLQIIARAVHERNVSTLQRAGADGVLSYAAFGATMIWNALGIRRRVVLYEGIELFAVPTPPRLRGWSINDPRIQRETGCHIVAVVDSGQNRISQQVTVPATDGFDILVMGSRHDERRFSERYLPQR